MTPRELLRTLRERHVVLTLEGSRLRCAAPAGALTPLLREAMEQHREALVRLLSLSAEQEPLPPRSPALVPYALSHAQQRIWFLDQLANARVAYVMPAAVLVRGPLDIGALQQALAGAVARHEALRLCFGTRDGLPVQWVVPHLDVHVPVLSLEEMPADRRREIAEERAAQEAGRPFDLERAPLFRTGLFRLSPDEHLWYIALHHLVADGTSLRILLSEVLDAYERYCSGQSLPHVDLDVQYGNFVEWQRDRLESGACAPSLEYWRGRLRGLTPLDLPSDRPRRVEKSFRGGCEMLHVPLALTERLRRLAREREASLYAVLLAAFQVVLARSAGQSDLAVGTAMAGRTRPELEGLVGCLANTVVIRAEVPADRTFVDLLDSVHKSVKDAWSHQELPFENIVEALKVREAGRNPIFDVFFALNVPIPPAVRARATFVPVFLKTAAAKFELALFCEDTADGIRGFMEYQSDLFDAGTVARILRRFVAVLDGVAAAPGTPAGRLPFLDQEERAQLEAGWNATRRPVTAATLPDLFAAQARRTPSAIAAADEARALTYAELDARSSAVARALRRRGCGAGALVGLSVERSVEMLVALLGILKSGSAYVPLDSSFPIERLRFIVEDSGAAAVLTSFEGPGDALRPRLEATIPDAIPLLVLEELMRADEPAGEWTTSPDDLAYVIYTSGSTGRPKGVEVTHRNVVNFLSSMAAEPGLAAGDALLAVTTLSFDIALLELFLPWVVGGRTLVASRETAADGDRLGQALVRSGATTMQATPATWRMLLDAGFRPGRRLKVLCGGEPLPPGLAAELLETAPEIWNLYGPTETTIWSTVARLAPGDPITLGRPIANTQIYILDERMQPVPFGVPGEICIGGDGVARGYRGRPDLTAERFLPDPFSPVPGARLYRTGDRGILGPDGSLRFLGRSDDQLKIRGFRIEPAEIEAALAKAPGVRQAAVVGWRQASEDVRLVAYLRCADGTSSPETYRRFLAERLPPYMVPAAYVRLDQFPMTPNGKVDRAALATRSVTDADDVLRAEPVPPRTAVERELAAVWQDILRLDRIGVRDSFFDLGGHSLLAARVIARVEASLGVRLPITLFFARATIEEHARYIERTAAPGEGRLEDLVSWIEGLSDEEAARYLEQYSSEDSQGAHS